jgi:Uma2 family endonuclease
MAVAEPKADVPGITRPMTYEEYISGSEEMARYDIIDGWKVYRLYGDKQLPNPTREHQQIQGNLYLALRRFAQESRQGQAIMSPCDVLITLRPWHSRQPDVLFISSERLVQNPPPDEPDPLSPAPELVVEIVSPSDTASVLAAKITDYRSVAVQEVWIVRSGDQTIEVMRLSAEQAETTDVYGQGDAAVSQVFPGLAVPVGSIFSQE